LGILLSEGWALTTAILQTGNLYGDTSLPPAPAG
jgi:hypothetical protein